MNSNSVQSTVYLLLLVIALVVALWLANILERSISPFPRQTGATEAEGGTLTFSPPGGAYNHSLLLNIRPSHPHSQIIFTTGGSVPTLTVGSLYERPLLLDASSPGVITVRACEIMNGIAGPMVSASYAIGVESTLPILSIIADPPDLWDTMHGIMSNTWQRGRQWEKQVHVTYIESNHSGGFEIPAGLRINGNKRSDEPKQSFRLYFRNDYGMARLEYPVFSEHPYQGIQSYDRLLLQAGDRSDRWTLLGEQLISDVASEIGRRATQGHFVLLFLNGEPWGVYRLGERIDRFFLADDFNIQSADLIRNGDIEEGDRQHWNDLMAWLAAHDLADEDNYAYIQTQVDIDDFTDYVVLQMYFRLAAERFSAARPRVGNGRWFWLYGDGDIGLTQSKNRVSILLEPSPADRDAAELSLLLHRLLGNSDYHTRFVGRVADLLNTALASEAIETHIDRLAAQLQPDIAYETTRWPSQTDWEQNVATLRNVVGHRAEEVRQQVIAALDLRGTARLRFETMPDNGGAVFVNGIRAPSSPWSGLYFLDTDVQVIAVPRSGYVFDGWEGEQMNAASPFITITVDGPRTFVSRFSPIPKNDPTLRPNDVIINEYWINDNGTRYTSIGNRPIEGDWLELLITRPAAVDLRGWRITDNASKTGTDEGSIILPHLDSLAAVPRGTVILIIATENNLNETYFGQDDLDPDDGQMIFYVGNDNLDVITDPGFGIGTNNESLALLAPGPSPAFDDDVGVDFVAEGDSVTPLSFGILADGVSFELPFYGLEDDDGVFFLRDGTSNDNGEDSWIVSPPANQSGDDPRMDRVNILTPGSPNHQPTRSALRASVLWLSLVVLTVATVAVYLQARHYWLDARRTMGR
jgi:uncharacterized repeat protein (TIGR02543 family)